MATLVINPSATISAPTRVRVATSRFYRPELDVLRFFAFLLVFLHHQVTQSTGSHWLHSVANACGAGLQLFFMLSSYLITELLLRESESTGSIHLKAFFIRRMLRIWPLYFAFIGASLLVSRLTNFTILTTPQFMAYIALVGNWYTAAFGFVTTIAGPLWSISVEEQYYVIWPFLARIGGRRALWAAAAFFLIASAIALAFLGIHHAPRVASWCNSFVEFQFFAAGAILALLLHDRTFALPTWARPAALISGLGVIVFAQVRFDFMGDERAGPFALLAGYLLLNVGVVLTFLSVYAMKVPDAARPIVYLGKISFGLYVFHDLAIRIFVRLAMTRPITPIVQLLASLAVCIALAMLSYQFLELPFLKLKKRFTLVASRAV